jgi:GNAT superfamily N-acetyltransferase
VIRELYTEATEWLRGKNTNQWLTPWPNAPMRHKRVLEDIAEHKTWIVSDEDITVGTITVDTEAPVDRANNHVWPAHRRSETALYVRRVIVRRSHAGLGLGARLLDWAADVAEQELGSPLLRIDVWTDNQGLHAYYKRQGFVFCEERDAAELPGYPARALFERRTSPNGWREQPPLLIE